MQTNPLSLSKTLLQHEIAKIRASCNTTDQLLSRTGAEQDQGDTGTNEFTYEFKKIENIGDRLTKELQELNKHPPNLSQSAANSKKAIETMIQCTYPVIHRWSELKKGLVYQLTQYLNGTPSMRICLLVYNTTTTADQVLKKSCIQIGIYKTLNQTLTESARKNKPPYSCKTELQQEVYSRAKQLGKQYILVSPITGGTAADKMITHLLKSGFKYNIKSWSPQLQEDFSYCVRHKSAVQSADTGTQEVMSRLRKMSSHEKKVVNNPL